MKWLRVWMCGVWTHVQDTVDINSAQVFTHAESAEYQEPCISLSRKLVLLQTLHLNWRENQANMATHAHRLPKAIEANLLLSLEEQKQLLTTLILHYLFISFSTMQCHK